jgi:hypothetical protein
LDCGEVRDNQFEVSSADSLVQHFSGYRSLLFSFFVFLLLSCEITWPKVL